MNSQITLALACGAILVVAGCGAQPADLSPASDASEAETAELVVTARAGADASAVSSLITSQGGTVTQEFKALSATLVEIQRQRAASARQMLAASPLIESVGDNQVYDAQLSPNDPEYGAQWALQVVGAPAAWEIGTGAAGIIIAVLDTGVETSHPDLQPRLLPGLDVFSHMDDSSDAHGHGTIVTGMLGASASNQIGITPLVWQSPVLPVRVTDARGRATSWTIAAGIRAATEAGARVANVSFGPLHRDRIVLAQARLAWLSGCMVVASAGNTGAELAGAGSDEVLFVGATLRSDLLAPFSSRGDFVDLVAPGVEVMTTRPGGTYGTASGTSVAAPLVSSAAALILGLRPELPVSTVRDLLLASAVDLGEPGWDARYGAGRLDAAAAMRLARSVVAAKDLQAPAVSIVSPAPGAAWSEPFVVAAEASDASGAPVLVLQLDGVTIAEDPIPPYSFVIDPAVHASGRHTLRVTATDLSGNQAAATIDVIFGTGDGTPPALSLISPMDGSTVRGLVTILVNATDAGALDRADILLDGSVIDTVQLLSQESARLAYNWNAGGASVTLGWHRITVRVYDSAGNRSDVSTGVTVTR